MLNPQCFQAGTKGCHVGHVEVPGQRFTVEPSLNEPKSVRLRNVLAKHVMQTTGFLSCFLRHRDGQLSCRDGIIWMNINS